MTINRLTTPCIVVHLATTEAHLPDAQQAEAWIEKLEADLRIHAIEEAQQPCWTAECDNPECVGSEDDENGNLMHFPGETAEAAEVRLSDLQRQPDGVLLCTMCRDGS